MTMILRPSIKPFTSGILAVSNLHAVYYEEAGRPDGKPVLIIHGGPGGTIEPRQYRYFDPLHWRMITFDQRGCGKSTPHAELRENTTQDLVADMERLRNHLGIDQWVLFGGSWGTTLALAYAQEYPQRCAGLILRGIFLVQRYELHWLYQEGASRVFPDAWEGFIAPIPIDERDSNIEAYYRLLTSPDVEVRLQAARAWSIWEGSISRLLPNPGNLKKFGEDEFADAFARLECHYFINNGFINEGQLLQGMDRMRSCPGIIIHGRYDMVCPVQAAWDLHRAWPEAELRIVPNAGHSYRERGITKELCLASESFK